MRSYLSTPDTRALASDLGANPAMTGGGDETGPRKRSLGKARRVLKNSTSPKEDEDAAKERTANGGYTANGKNSQYYLVLKNNPYEKRKRPY